MVVGPPERYTNMKPIVLVKEGNKNFVAITSDGQFEIIDLHDVLNPEVDIDEISSEILDSREFGRAVESALEDADLFGEDEVQTLLDDGNYMNERELERYLENTDFVTEEKLEDEIRDAISELPDEDRVEEMIAEGFKELVQDRLARLEVLDRSFVERLRWLFTGK